MTCMCVSARHVTVGGRSPIIPRSGVLEQRMDRVESPSPQELLDEITGSDAWLRLIWESAPDAMALSDPDGTVLMVNPAYYYNDGC